MAWGILVFAGILEVGWAVGLKYTKGFTRFWPGVLTIAARAWLAHSIIIVVALWTNGKYRSMRIASLLHHRPSAAFHLGEEIPDRS